jgi:hypothetical protein
MNESNPVDAKLIEEYSADLDVLMAHLNYTSASMDVSFLSKDRMQMERLTVHAVAFRIS